LARSVSRKNFKNFYSRISVFENCCEIPRILVGNYIPILYEFIRKGNCNKNIGIVKK